MAFDTPLKLSHVALTYDDPSDIEQFRYDKMNYGPDINAVKNSKNFPILKKKLLKGNCSLFTLLIIRNHLD
jgi:hypothetical protein